MIEPSKLCMRLMLFIAGVLAVAIMAGPANAELKRHAHLSAELISQRQAVTAGVDGSVALRLVPDDGWHVYWRNAGDSGSAPQLIWQINNQSINSETHWPTPEVIRVGHLANYGYTKEVLLLTDLPIPEDVSGKVSISLDAEWLVCQEECIPGNGLFELQLPVAQTQMLPPPTTHYQRIETFQNRLPTVDKALQPTLSLSPTDDYILTINRTFPKKPELRFFPSTTGVIKNAAEQITVIKADSTELHIPKSTNQNPKARKLSGILRMQPMWPDGSLSKEISVALPTTASPLSLPETQQQNKTKGSLFLFLLGAFLGGMLLNLMPCVFPVLSIKVLSFVKKAGKCPTQIRGHGLAFTAGIIASFWVLALAIRAFREAGEHLGWGFQLQNPAFIAFLILLLIAVALNFFGVFEFGSSIQRACGTVDTDGDGKLTSFLTGILLTLLATPCTAPFMGSALAYGLSASFVKSLLVFTALGLGLASPYLLLSFCPALLAKLPKPGEWMETFKQLMGFPVLLTALWLFTVFNQQGTQDEMMALLAAALFLSFALWVYGKICPPCSSRKRQILGLTILCISLASCAWIGIPKNGASSAKESVAGSDSAITKDSYGMEWHAYSAELLDSLLQKGQPIYVDFTAAWCVTCQVNKKMVFGSEIVRKRFAKENIALVRADWTNEDPEITKAIASFGRAGVPLNVLYNPKSPEEPKVLPALLTPQIVLTAIDELTG